MSANSAATAAAATATGAATATTGAAQHVRDRIADYPDFPTAGILFRDLTPVFADAAAFRSVIDAIADAAPGDITAVAGVEARGFLLASAIAYRADTGMLAIRKAGKLPGDVLAESYDLEYGSASLELHPVEGSGASPVSPRARGRVLLVDDVLATGGTLVAAARLLERCGYEVAGIAVVLEIAALDGRQALDGYVLTSILVA